jgi:protein ImuB
MIVVAANKVAESKGVSVGMVLADARAVIVDLQVRDDKPDLVDKLLRRLGEWCIRFTPFVAIDPPDGLLFDVTGCSHLWDGDEPYLKDIIRKLTARGYDVRAAMADTIGSAWGIARFANSCVVPIGKHVQVLMNLPSAALRIDAEISERLHKLGLHRIRQFSQMPRPALRRRFGAQFLHQLDKALGQEIELVEPIHPIEPYHERLPCMDPIVTAAGIEIALNRLLELLCVRLEHEQKGIRTAAFKCYRVDNKIEQIEIGTSRPSRSIKHLFKLFEIKIASIEPSLGIELFVLEAPKVEDLFPAQEKMWEGSGGLKDSRVSELLDRIANKIGENAIHRYVADEHYWPERSIKLATSLEEISVAPWREEKPRPIQLLKAPEAIEVTAPIPDYPPMLFRYKEKLHTIIKADGPERIEQEWWLQQGEHRDYYRVEDDEGNRYWLFRLGHYHEERYQWFIHGFFA